MSTLSRTPTIPEAIPLRAESIFQAAFQGNCARADCLFGRLMFVQWLAGIAAAFWLSPRTWIGAQSEVHLHVWAAVLLGGAISGFPILLAISRAVRCAFAAR